MNHERLDKGKPDIRINDLARELEIKAKVIIDFLHEIDLPVKKGYSSPIAHEIAEKVRAHFRQHAAAKARKKP